MDFIEGIGPGQKIKRQVLAAPSLGDVQLSLCYKKGYLLVEVIRARGLRAKEGSKVVPGRPNLTNRQLTCTTAYMTFLPNFGMVYNIR